MIRRLILIALALLTLAAPVCASKFCETTCRSRADGSVVCETFCY